MRLDERLVAFEDERGARLTYQQAQQPRGTRAKRADKICAAVQHLAQALGASELLLQFINPCA
eukprot:5806257-Prymnesium_polylepis.2